MKNYLMVFSFGRPTISLIFGIFVFTLFGMIPNTYAVDGTISDSASCFEMDGLWVEPDICEISRDFDINQGQQVIISSDIKLEIKNTSHIEINFDGRLTNHGLIRHQGIIEINQGGSLVNSRIFTQLHDGVIENSDGVIMNSFSGIYNNRGSIKISEEGVQRNEGTFNNYGTIQYSSGSSLLNQDDGTFVNEVDGTIINQNSEIKNGEFGGLFENKGTVHNTGKIVNKRDGTFLMYAPSSINSLVGGEITNEGKFENRLGKIFNYGGSITNTLGGDFINYGGSIINGNSDPVFPSRGTITNLDGNFENRGSITNYSRSIIEIFATFINFDNIKNNGRINVQGTLINHGGTIDNRGSINNQCATFTGQIPTSGNPITDLCPPVISYDSNITVLATSPSGAVVDFNRINARDNPDGEIPVTCNPSSGTEFPIGTTQVTCSATDSAGNSSERSFDVIVQSSADLRISISDDPDPVLAGNSVTYTVLLSNSGPLDATNVIVTEILPSDGSLSSIISSQGSCTGLSCNLGTLPPNNDATLTVVIDVDPAKVGLLANAVTVQSDSKDPTPTNRIIEETRVDPNIQFPPSIDWNVTTDSEGNLVISASDLSDEAEIILPPDSEILGPVNVNFVSIGTNTALEITGISATYPPGKTITFSVKPSSTKICIIDKQSNLLAGDIPNCNGNDLINSQVLMDCNGITQTFSPFPKEPISRDYKCSKFSDSGKTFMKVEGLANSFVMSIGDEGGGCLIATATYGSELAPQVQHLREIRDNQLLSTQSGSAFVSSFNQFYYIFSPTVADIERQNPIFKEVVKLSLTPMISSLSILNYVDLDSEEKVLGYGLGLISLNIGMYLGIPLFAVFKIRNKFKF